ncbi:MAG: conserved exported protein of unknown function [Candidatus Thorarchaeota archaeon]|nr:MAG: conserved exported protein of unknown function [Candidatus Thorarchaeota archaeon]
MIRFKNPSRIIVIIFAVLFVSASLQCPVQAQAVEPPVLILFDASHSPQHAPDDEAQGLKIVLDRVNESTKYIVKINEDPLNDTILNDVDVLIIAAPDASAEFELNETKAIVEMMNNGSSLLFLGDPMINQTSNYWSNQVFRDIGENYALNTLFDQINMTSVRFSTNTTESANTYCDALFDLQNALNATQSPSLVAFDSTTWDASHPIFNDINTIVTMTATLKPVDLASSIAYGYDTSFAQYRRGPNSFANISYPNMTLSEFEANPYSYSAINGTFPPWLSAFTIDSSRVIVGGSTLMFTGRMLDLEDAETAWYEVADNTRLFLNMIDWLSEDFIESPSAISNMFIISSVILLIGVAFYLIKKRA